MEFISGVVPGDKPEKMDFENWVRLLTMENEMLVTQGIRHYN